MIIFKRGWDLYMHNLEDMFSPKEKHIDLKHVAKARKKMTLFCNIINKT